MLQHGSVSLSYLQPCYTAQVLLRLQQALWRSRWDSGTHATSPWCNTLVLKGSTHQEVCQVHPAWHTACSIQALAACLQLCLQLLHLGLELLQLLEMGQGW